MIKNTNAEFIMSNTDIEKCPAPNLPEYAFIGRSNVGKSSLINMICNHKGLAKTSGKPGKTQLINHFIINKAWYLVDLPGYGYAKTSKTNRSAFLKLIYSYLESRENLVCVFQLIDARMEPQASDLNFMRWMGEKGVPFVMIFTKVDKLSSSELQRNLANYKKEMLKQWEEIPQMFTSSAESKMGREKILAFIDDLNKNYKPQ